MSAPLFKVLTAAEWAAFERDGRFEGGPLDRQHGFIHLCAGDQVAGVVERFFADQNGLYVVAVGVPRDKRLKWEENDHGCFPHFYGALDRAWVLGADLIPDEPDARRLALALLAV